MKSFVITLALTMLTLSAWSQQLKTVTGFVLNAGEGREPMPYKDAGNVRVLAFNTVAGAQEALKKMESGMKGQDFMQDSECDAELDGYFALKVLPTGALLVHVKSSMKKVIEPVNGRDEVKILVQDSYELPPVVVTHERTVAAATGGGEMEGNMLHYDGKVTIPRHYGKSNARFVVLPYLYDCTLRDTVTFLRPFLIDGDGYHLTQFRRTGFDWKRDPLHDFQVQLRDSSGFVVPFDGRRNEYAWHDSIRVKHPMHSYKVRGYKILADYTHLIDSADVKLGAVRTPMRFLQYNTMYIEPDAERNRPRQRLEKMNTEGNIQLTFVVGKAEIDPQNPQNQVELQRFNSELMAIVNGSDTRLNNLTITGISSPEGRYDSNLALARSRMRHAADRITRALPDYARSTLAIIDGGTRVATWMEVAEVLQADSLLTEAEAVRQIAARFSTNPDAQFAAVRALPCYEPIIKPRLPRLRRVNYNYQYVVNRTLSADEIMHRYRNDADFSSGKKPFTQYEYWQLIQLLTDPAEREQLLRRAIDDSRRFGGKPWLYASNCLAASYLKRDTFDIDLLLPFYDHTVPQLNKEIDFGSGPEVHNPEEAIVNLLSMSLVARRTDLCMDLVKLLPADTRYDPIRAFADCACGYYKIKPGMSADEQQRVRQSVNWVAHSSDRNWVVVQLAQPGTDTAADIMRRRAIYNRCMQLPDDAVSCYLKAVICARMRDVLPAIQFSEDDSRWLMRAIRQDRSLQTIAESDGDIPEEVYVRAVEMLNEES